MFSLVCNLMFLWRLQFTRYLTIMGNEVTTEFNDEVACLRDSGFVQRIRLDRDLRAAQSHDLNRLLDKPVVMSLL